MLHTPMLSEIKRKTLWVCATALGFTAFDENGVTVATHKHKATLIYIIRHELAVAEGWIAIADVVLPSNRQPNRKPPRRKRYGQG